MHRRLDPLRRLLEQRPWLRLIALLVAGIALALPGFGVLHAVAPGTDVRGLVVESSTDRQGSGYRSRTDYTMRAVTADGAELDLGAGGAGIPLSRLAYGDPVVITRSTADGRVLRVRAPLRDITVANHAGSLFLQAAALAIGAAGIAVGLLGAPRRWVRTVALLLVGGLIGSGLFHRTHDLGPYRGPPVPDATAGYAIPPTEGTGLDVATLLPVGTTVAAMRGGLFTVTGPPVRGLPAGMDPAVAAGFDAVHIPVLSEPDEESGRYGPNTDSLPNMELIGTGAGRVTAFGASPDSSDPFASCPGAPSSFPANFAAPRSGHVCFLVPDGFVPRYLVLFNDDVAITLPAG